MTDLPTKRKIVSPCLGEGVVYFIQYVLHPNVDEVAVQHLTCCIYLDHIIDFVRMFGMLADAKIRPELWPLFYFFTVEGIWQLNIMNECEVA